MFQYVSTLRSLSKGTAQRLIVIISIADCYNCRLGRAQYSMELAKYDFVPNNVEKELSAKFKPNSGDDE